MGEYLKSVIDAVFRRDGGGGDGGVCGVNGVVHNDVFGIAINGSLAEVVLKGYTSAEAFFGAEVSRSAGANFLVDKYKASKRDKRDGTIVDGGVEVLPSLNIGIYSGLNNKV